MDKTTIRLTRKEATGFVLPAGPVSLVYAITDRGLIACGLIDVSVLDRFNFPAARLKARGKPLIASVEDLLDGEVKEANASAQALGVKPGMSGREALEMF